MQALDGTKSLQEAYHWLPFGRLWWDCGFCNGWHIYNIRDQWSLWHALNEKAKVSKFAAPIGSTVAHNDEQCPLFLPTFAHLDDLKAEIDAAQASKASSVTPEFLSKIWNI